MKKFSPSNAQSSQTKLVCTKSSDDKVVCKASTPQKKSISQRLGELRHELDLDNVEEPREKMIKARRALLEETVKKQAVKSAKLESVKVSRPRRQCKGDVCKQGELEIGTESTFVQTDSIDGQKITLVSEKCANPFHGWWAKADKSMLGGYGSDFNTFAQIGSEDIDAYIFIDTTVTPIKITTIGGNGKDVRLPKPTEVADRPFYYQKDATTLLSVLADNPGDPLTAVFGNNYNSLKLQEDGTLIALTDQGTETPSGNIALTYHADGLLVGIYKKISRDDLPKPLPAYDELDYRGTDFTLPTNLFRYIFNRMLYHGIMRGGEGTADNWNPDFIGFQNAWVLFNQYITTGKTYTSTINKTRTTKNDSGMTNIYTEQFAYAPAGSTVTISGFGGGWAAANGTYSNGSSTHAFGGVPNPNPLFLDVESPENTGAGTWRHHFYLRFDSSNLPQFDNNNGYPNFADGSANPSLWGNQEATVTVTHRVTDDIEYPALIAAVQAFFYDAFKVAQHTGFTGWGPASDRKFLADTWEEAQALLNSDEARIAGLRTRTNHFTPNLFYQNAAVKYPYNPNSRPLPSTYWDFNDPYGVLPEAGNKFDYNVDAQNYLVGVSNLYYTLDGIPTKPRHSIAGLFGYKNLSGTDAGGSYFVSQVAPMNFEDPAAGNPDENVWSLMGVDWDSLIAEDPVKTAANSLFFGFVDPLLTSGKKIGYIYWQDELRLDSVLLMTSVDFTRVEDQDSPRFGLEGYASLLAPMMIYLNTMHPDGPGLDSIIFDNRTNAGGSVAANMSIASFFGAKRHYSDGVVAAWRDNGQREPLKFVDDLGYDGHNNLLSLLDQQEAFIYVDESLARYGPDAIFTGGPVVVLHSSDAASAGDEILNVWLGENNDKDIGAGTHTVTLGSADGRLKGGQWIGYSDALPLQKYSERLKDSSSEPVSAIPLMRLDLPLAYMKAINGRKISVQSPEIAIDEAPTLQGKAGGNPLPEDFESTIYVDFGYMYPHPDSALPGWVELHGTAQPDPNDNTTWRDRWLEQAIESAIINS